ncbi:uncharacterized protein LOC100381487 [Zea mays]|uniref:Spc97 / Spc98 family of spindle pole body (SBP) component n=2 Tax=Zea mays TaxID=4577 RepID=A0A1D6E2T1_MAIZE|nr:uncharacterized protein LOC100381487 [Zea mays]ONM14881.1 Spc97 / Spc98 family of spindle pole body (SBP) component [Zea mays]ONM14889.1 Spc97 / Spc98 family of spindle pole body (SBP) component [Zea mays]ONM14895.1 Spc97 / Spc98 family of spindle pole body (SBP) component [Zea mays]ONM14900.1 Spc97 / Spc98 family of spindle pole body (SBP) component [Zea mays]ONM14902.1 Spc97 / Spc98 family of spindle pole body (SBP) component [Zea mays]|eukprot:XP_008668252.1 uncharacterized protein LOC100381487 isoform X2 [Zea mays]
MEAAASSLSTLLSTLRVNGPWTPPGTWESVIPESGAARVSHLGGRPRLQPIYELASVTDDALIHLALHALYGVKTSLDEIEELSALSSSNPADRTSNRVPNVWLRSSSTTSMGSILKSFRSTGLAVFFLCKFVHFYLFQSREMNCASREVHEHEDSGDKDTKQHQPYTLVNQAFAAAVNKVLEGYFCSLNTLLASIRLRRSVGQSGIASKISNGMSCDPTSEVTLLEVYLHTEELRRHVKSLGNICFPKFAGLTLCQEGLNTDANVEFENFPRGTDLLSYLYVHIRDADPVHYGLLKYLFIRSCEPYFNFIKSWIYRASVDDPYEEFLITQTENKGAQGISSDITDDFILFPLKGRNHVSAPCFLKEICHPLLRTGQQLQVLMNLLKYCNLAATEGDVYPSRNIIHMEGVLPWFDTPIESSMNSFTFSKSAIEALTCKRDAMYKLMMEKLQHFFSNVEVIAFDTASNFLHKRTDLVDASVSDAELFYGDSDAVLPCNMAADEKDDSSSNSQESSDKEDPLESSECSSYTSMDDTEVESSTACENLSSSMFSLYCTSTGEAKGSLVTSKLLSSQSSSVDHGINCAIPIECEKDDRLSCKHVLVHPQNTKHTAVPDGSELDYQYSQFSPFDRFMKRASCSFESMNSVGEFLYSDHKRSVGNAVYPLHSESGSTKLSNSKNYEKFVTINQPWNTSIPYNLSLNPILKNAACYHTESDMQQKSKNQSLASFDFESVMDPCEVYCARSPSLLVESVNGAATAGQPSTQPYEQPDCSTKLLQAQTRSQSSLTSSGEMSTGDSLQKNASGGAFWEISLLYNDKSKEKPAMDFSSQFDMPLDIVIDKCIIQEILLQYKYVSSFTMKLLEEGFDLCAHLLALRRYHFMEIADWADSFIASIYQKKWSFVKSEQKRSEIQGLMDLALQRSSCDSDPYKERLFIYMRESPVDSVDASPCGLDLLDDILLGYKAEWPMNIVITVDALKIYAEIFCYLLQVRFAVFSLTEVWRFLKELTQFIGRSSHSRSDVLKKLNFVMKLRHKLYHFLSTLQQYLHCHLSDISWRRFQHSLKNQVRDILDLEYVHICYITDALDICFLSDESKQVATIIKSMLQLALELRSCFQSGDTCDLSVNQLSNLQYLINFSQVDVIRTKFEDNIKDLYILHSKSSKYTELGLSRFWGYLNYNEYHSTKVSKDMDNFYF